MSSKHALWITLATFLLLIFVMEYAIMLNTNGVFSYPLDDVYIHLAIARNIAFYHVWGISPQGFTSASSSVLYPLLLAGTLKIFGAHTIIPFIINLLTGLLFLVALHKWLVRQELGPVAQLSILLVVILVTPLTVIVMCGMEHMLQIWFCFLFVTRFSEELAAQVETGKRGFSWQLYAYGFLLTATRYEGAVLIGIAGLIAFFEGRMLTAVKLVVVSVLPIIIFGAYAQYHGSYAIPNSVLLKSGAPPLTIDGMINFFFDDLYNKLSISTGFYATAAPQRLLLILPLTYLFCRPAIPAIKYRYMIILLTLATLCYLLLTGRTRFPRYEAYLIANGAIVSGVLLFRYGKQALSLLFAQAKWLLIFVGFILVIPILLRSRDALTLVHPASVNIYQQQYQMGLFLGKYYYNTPVAFNDIGAASYFTRGGNLDLWGLGSYEITKSIKNGYYSPGYIEQLTQKDSIRIAVIFERYIPQGVWQNWNKVGSWQLRSNVICADDSVSFFAVRPEEAVGLRKHLQAYESLLPNGVIAHYY
ncbi:hypothetical protein [Chitinophaga sp. GbtcB8]|uniref:hypothetical protein n=1 Tax=Chitinophaga sp. GbtcB8 TaxID=2824753 RepID=UPI001C309ADD|nr:hypothetical protein [Chitinophaga sp. GbtcB8]